MQKFRFIIFYIAFFMLVPLVLADEGSDSKDSFPDLLGDDLVDAEIFAEPAEPIINDFLEPMNRVFFEINDVLYVWVLDPIIDGYRWFFPKELRQSLASFSRNLITPIRFVNAIFQGDLEKTGVILQRFLINSTIGVAGLIDVADIEFDIHPRRADFGQTLGRWGMDGYVYLYWPILGPSNLRDTVGLVVDVYLNPVPYLNDDKFFNITYITYCASTRVNTLSLRPHIYEDITQHSFDPYIAVRQAYYEYRRNIIREP